MRIIITVSPVPLHRTFTEEDALIANAYGKSTLRAVATDVARTRADVDYFPAYELVTVSDRSTAFGLDQLHVSPAMSDLVGTTFLETYGLAPERPHPEFNESAYLRANPDVERLP